MLTLIDILSQYWLAIKTKCPRPSTALT